jgi:hypothetical protein
MSGPQGTPPFPDAGPEPACAATVVGTESAGFVGGGEVSTKCASALDAKPSRAIVEARRNFRISNLRDRRESVERVESDSIEFWANANPSMERSMQQT